MKYNAAHENLAGNAARRANDAQRLRRAVGGSTVDDRVAGDATPLVTRTPIATETSTPEPTPNIQRRDDNPHAIPLNRLRLHGS